jgi:hypothetical protein
MSRTISAAPLLPCWNEYKRRRRAFGFSLLLLPLWLVPGGTIQAFLAGWGYGATSPVTFLAVVVPPMACVAVCYLRWVFWLCPQCGWPFRLAWFRNGWLTRHCLHCGLPMWDAPVKMKPDGKSPFLDELA